MVILMSFWIPANAIELKIEQEHLRETGRFETDYLFTGTQLGFTGAAEDLIFLGERLDFSGDLTKGIIAFGRTIDVNGRSRNGIRSGAQYVTIDGLIEGTSFIGAEQVIWGPGSQANGDTFIGARIVSFRGPMKGDIYVGAAEVSVENEITGNAQIRTGQLRILEKGRINGNLTYYSDQELSQEERSRVTGTIRYVTGEESFFSGRPDSVDDMPFWLQIILKLALALLGFIILLLPVARKLEKQRDFRGIISMSLWGLIPIFIYPTLIIFFILLIITLPLAGAMILAAVPLYFVVKTIGVTSIGGFLVKRLNLNTNSRFVYYLVGIALYSLLSAIPYFGILLMIFVSSIGCGLALSLLLDRQLSVE